MSKNKRIIKVLGAVVGLLIIAALVLAARTFGGSNITRAREIAARLQASAIANPNPVAGTASTTGSRGTAAVPAATSGGAAASTSSAAGARSSGTAATPPAKNNSQVATGKSSSTTSTAAAGKASASAPSIASPPVSVAKKALRRQPTNAEIAQAITAVNSLLPFFTPTATQIASAGDQVCTALDQGQPLSQVASQALDMVGAGSISWMIPASDPEIAIRTLVALYCPTNASKLP